MQLKVDVPQGSFQGYSAQITQSLHDPASVPDPDDFTGDFDDDHSDEDYVHTRDVAASDKVGGDSTSSSSNTQCNSGLEEALGISSCTTIQKARGQRVAAVRSKSYVQKSEEDITAYIIGFSWKNPGKSTSSTKLRN